MRRFIVLAAAVALDYVAVTLQPPLGPLMAVEQFGAGRIGS